MNKFDSNYFVEAGAGAGKTYTIVNMIANLLVEEKQEPSEVVAITFTNKSTQELYARITAKLEELASEDSYTKEDKEYIKNLLFRVPEIQISTIHSFCETMLRTMPFESKIGAEFEQIEFMSEEVRKYLSSRKVKGQFDQRLELLGAPSYAYGLTLESLVKYIHADIGYHDFESIEIKPYREKFVRDINRIHTHFSKRYYVLQEEHKKIISQEFSKLLEQSSLEEDDCYIFYSFLKGDYSELIDKAYHGEHMLLGYGNKIQDTLLQNANNKDPKLGEFIQLLYLFDYKNKNGSKSANSERVYYIREKIEKDDSNYTDEELAINAYLDQEHTPQLIHALAMPTLCKIASEYVKSYREENLVSKDDLLTYTRDMLRDSKPARDYFHNKYKKIFVDEFQDTDNTQVELLCYLAAKTFDQDWRECQLEDATLFVVGDPKQAIYRFRGADLSTYNEVKNKFKDDNCTITLLGDNYRSTKEICDFVDQTFGKKGHKLHLTGEKGQSPYTQMNSIKGEDTNSNVYQYEVVDSKDDVKRITAFINTAVNSGQANYGDFLILTAVKRDSEAYATELLNHSIPSNVSGSQQFNDNPAVDNIIKAFDFCANANSNMELAEVLIQVYNCEYEAIRRCMWLIKDEEASKKPSLTELLYNTEKLLAYKLGEQEIHLYNSLLELKSLLAKMKKGSAHPMSLLEYMVEGGVSIYTDVEEEYLKVINFQEEMRQYKDLDLATFTKKMGEVGETMLEKPIILNENAVRIMNIHKAKGLEGKIVILGYHKFEDKKDKINSYYDKTADKLDLCVSIKKFKLAKIECCGTSIDWDQSQDKEYEEECAERVRLMYVAVTRAESILLMATNSAKPSYFQDIAEGVEKLDENHNVYGPAFKELLNPSLTTATRIKRGYNGFPLVQGQIQEMRNNIEAMPTVISPSQLNKSSKDKSVDEELTREEKVEKKGKVKVENSYKAPYGAEYGTIVHRIMELIALDGHIDRLNLHIEKATKEVCSELQGSKQLFGKELTVPSTGDITALCEKIGQRLKFLEDENNILLNILQNKTLYPELRFFIQENGDGQLGKYLKNFKKLKDVDKFSVEGIIDLVYEEDGIHHIIDYKTDSMKAEETDEDYKARLIEEYSPQLNAYKTLLSEKKEVGNLYISAIPLAGELIEVDSTF